MTIDIDRVRRDTRACEVVTHFNNAGAALPPAVVMDTVREHLRSEESFGGYEAQALAAEALEHARRQVASLIGGAAAEIAFFDSATRAWQSALYALDWREGDRILTARAEYPSAMYSYAYLRDRFGVEVDIAPDDGHGQVDVTAMRSLVTDRTRLVAATHMPTFSGLINPVAAVGQVAREAGVPFLLDACQSAGQLHLDVDEIGCDMLTAAGRKFVRGPRGSAFLWVRDSALARLRPAFADNHSAEWSAPGQFTLRDDARRFEPFEGGIAGYLGLGAAAKYCRTVGTRDIEERALELGAQLRGALVDVPGVAIQDRGERLGAIVTFTVDGVPATAAADRLRDSHINVSVTPATSAQLAFGQRGVEAVVRASPHYYDTHAEVDRVVEAVAALRR